MFYNSFIFKKLFVLSELSSSIITSYLSSDYTILKATVLSFKAAIVLPSNLKVN